MNHKKSIPLDTLQPATRKRLYRAIRALPAGTYAVDVAPQRWKASSAQRGYYWGYLIVEVGKRIGRDREQTDQFLNALFLAETWTVAGEAVTVVGSFSSLDNVGLSNYFAAIRMWVWQKFKVRLHEPEPSERAKPIEQ